MFKGQLLFLTIKYGTKENSDAFLRAVLNVFLKALSLFSAFLTLFSELSRYLCFVSIHYSKMIKGQLLFLIWEFLFC